MTVQEAISPTVPRARLRYLFDREGVLGPVMLLPAVLYLAALVGFPLVLVFLYSFSSATTGTPGVTLTGIGAYLTTLRDPVFWTSVRNTVLFTVVAQAIVVVLSTILGFILSTDFRGKWIVRFLILLPWTTPIALSALVWLWMLDSIFSPFNWILGEIGVIPHNSPVAWLGTTGLAMGSVIALQAWRTLPLSTVILMAGLTSIPGELREQAEIDGASFLRRLFDIILPLLIPIITVALLFGIVTTFTDMAVVFILTSGGPDNATQVLASWSFYTGIQGGDLARGAAIALFMFPVLLGISILMLRFAGRSQSG
ncbi:MAG: carbohydrate ABC transporter permease [Candidatus Dormibacteraceae bacterium]